MARAADHVHRSPCSLRCAVRRLARHRTRRPPFSRIRMTSWLAVLIASRADFWPVAIALRAMVTRSVTAGNSGTVR